MSPPGDEVSNSLSHRLMAPPAAPQVSGRVIQASVWIPRSTHWVFVWFKVNALFTWENKRIIDNIHPPDVISHMGFRVTGIAGHYHTETDGTICHTGFSTQASMWTLRSLRSTYWFLVLFVLTALSIFNIKNRNNFFNVYHYTLSR